MVIWDPTAARAEATAELPATLFGGVSITATPNSMIVAFAHGALPSRGSMMASRGCGLVVGRGGLCKGVSWRSDGLISGDSHQQMLVEGAARCISV